MDEKEFEFEVSNFTDNIKSVVKTINNIIYGEKELINNKIRDYMDRFNSDFPFIDISCYANDNHYHRLVKGKNNNIIVYYSNVFKPIEKYGTENVKFMDLDLYTCIGIWECVVKNFDCNKVLGDYSVGIDLD